MKVNVNKELRKLKAEKNAELDQEILKVKASIKELKEIHTTSEKTKLVEKSYTKTLESLNNLLDTLTALKEM